MASPAIGSPPRDRPDAETEAKFRRLAAEWDQATCFFSSMQAAYEHPAYRQIIAMGPKIVPLLLRDLEQTNSHWFAALREITGANPAPSSAAGNVPKMVEAWLKWARASSQWF